MNAMLTQAPGCTADFIALHARKNADHPAVISGGVATSYAALDRELDAMTQALSQLALPREAIVAVAHSDIHVCLLVTLTFERLGVTVAPFRSDDGEAADSVFLASDLVMSDTPILSGQCKQFLHMTDEWYAGVLSEAPERGVAPERSTGHPVLLIRSSGSTGRPKSMIVTRAMLDARVRQRTGPMEFHSGDRFLAVTHFTIASIFYSCLTCLRLGATVMADHWAPLGQTLARDRPTCAYMLPTHLAALLNEAERLPRLEGLRLLVGGTKLTSGLRRRAVEQLCGRIIHLYGTNETSSICTFDEEDLGTPFPGVIVEVASADEARAPAGAIGEIRVRSPAMITGYRDGTAGEVANPRHGWWYTGDFGFITPAGRLRLLGRRDDVLNFGGSKRAAADVEADIRSFGVTHELAVMPGESGDGSPFAVVCVAAETDAVVAEISALIRSRVAGRFVLFRVDAIPRTTEGKVSRLTLRQDIARRQPVIPAEAARQLEDAPLVA